MEVLSPNDLPEHSVLGKQLDGSDTDSVVLLNNQGSYFISN